jgi:hypothetical protein
MGAAILVVLICILGALLWVCSELRWLSKGVAILLEHLGVPKKS